MEFRWLYSVSGIRVLVGSILVVAASSTGFPGFVRAFGVTLIVAGISIPLLGEERVDRMAEWWLRQLDWMLRAWRLSSGLWSLSRGSDGSNKPMQPKGVREFE